MKKLRSVFVLALVLVLVFLVFSMVRDLACLVVANAISRIGLQEKWYNFCNLGVHFSIAEFCLVLKFYIGLWILYFLSIFSKKTKDGKIEFIRVFFVSIVLAVVGIVIIFRYLNDYDSLSDGF